MAFSSVFCSLCIVAPTTTRLISGHTIPTYLRLPPYLSLKIQPYTQCVPPCLQHSKYPRLANIQAKRRDGQMATITTDLSGNVHIITNTRVFVVERLKIDGEIPLRKPKRRSFEHVHYIDGVKITKCQDCGVHCIPDMKPYAAHKCNFTHSMYFGELAGILRYPWIPIDAEEATVEEFVKDYALRIFRARISQPKFLDEHYFNTLLEDP